MTDNELLLAMSEMMKSQMEPFKEEMREMITETVKSEMEPFKEEVREMITETVKTEIEPLEKDVKEMKLLIENDVLPRLQNIESCYVTTYEIFRNKAEQIDTMQTDVDMLKLVVTEHSEKLQKIS